MSARVPRETRLSGPGRPLKFPGFSRPWLRRKFSGSQNGDGGCNRAILSDKRRIEMTDVASPTARCGYAVWMPIYKS
jgi:hypothetical protein